LRVFVRTGTPPEIIAKLNEVVTAFVNSPDARSYLATIGATPFPSTPQGLAAFQENGHEALGGDRRDCENRKEVTPVKPQ
jgi:tripartite-type tricarboxylate transporter receptor subunit TctC